MVTAGRRDPGHPVDVTRPGSLAALVESVRPAAVVHLAGGVASGATSTWELNLLPGLELLHTAARCRRPPRVVLIGSAAEYGVAGDQVTEETSTHPVSDYGRAKNVQTMAARSFQRAGAEVLVLRPFNVVAPDLPPSNALGNLRAQVMARADPRRRAPSTVDGWTSSEISSRLTSWPRWSWPACATGRRFPCSTWRPAAGSFCGELFDAFAAEASVKLEYHPDPELVAIPAPDILTADPIALEDATGLRAEADVRQLARALIGEEAASGSAGEPT